MSFFCSKESQCRDIKIYVNRAAVMNKGARAMDIVIFAGVAVLWVVLQLWVLPYFGVKT